MKSYGAVLVAVLLVACFGCGGGGGSTSTPVFPAPPPAPTFAVSTTTLPPATRNQPYSATLSATGGTGTLTWTAIPPLAEGLSLSSAGVLSGTPKNAGTGNVSVSVTDSGNPAKTATKVLGVDIFGFTYQLGYNPGTVNSSFYQGNYVVGGGVQPITWTITSGALPPGLRVNVYTDIQPPDAVTRNMSIVGTPTQDGTYSFTVRAQDSGSPARFEEQTSQITINPAMVSMVTTALPHATVGQSYSYPMQATGGIPPYTWSLDAFSKPLPAGLTLNANTGVISGTPTTGSNAALIFWVTDGTRRASQSMPFYVAPTALSARNDSLTTATPIYPGTYYASLSPYGGAGAVDSDYFKMTASGGTSWHIAVTGLDKNRGYTGLNTIAIDAVVEILDANGHRLSTCNDPADDNPPSGVPIAKDATPTGYDDPCMNNGTEFGKAKGAYLDFKVPGTTQSDFFIHVFDWRGYARPDMNYRLDITKNP